MLGAPVSTRVMFGVPGVVHGFCWAHGSSFGRLTDTHVGALSTGVSISFQWQWACSRGDSGSVELDTRRFDFNFDYN